MNRPLFLCCALTLTLAPGAGSAEGDAIIPAKLTVAPTFECLGVELEYTGDLNFNASGKVEYRAAGETSWRNGHPLVRVSDTPMHPDGKGASNPRFYSSVFQLAEGTEYEVKVTMEDADGVKAQLPPEKIRTRVSAVTTGGGKEYFVDANAATEGDGSKGAPFKSLEKGLSVGGPGDTVRFAKGTYHFKGDIYCGQSGDENASLRILGEPGSIITDAEPAISGMGKLAWEKFKLDADGNQIWKLPVKDAHRVMLRTVPGDPSTGVFFWRYLRGAEKSPGPHRGEKLEDLVANYPTMNQGGAFFQDDDALYVTLPKGIDDPATADVQISLAREGQADEGRAAASGPNSLHLTGKHVVFEGLSFELTAGLTCKGRSDRNPGQNIIFRRLACYGNFARHGLDMGPNCLVEDSVLRFNANRIWHTAPPAKAVGHHWENWWKVKNGVNDVSGIKTGPSCTIRYNTFSGVNNVIGAGSNEGNVDIYNNHFEHSYDDCIEPDGPAINWRIFDNQLNYFYNGFSDAPVKVGPAFVVRNIFANHIANAFKIRNKALGKTIYYHNATLVAKDPVIYASTGQKLTPAPPVWPIPEEEQKFKGMAFAADDQGDMWMRTRNNIFVGGRFPYRTENIKVGKNGKFNAVETMDWDYNVLTNLEEPKHDHAAGDPKIGEEHSLRTLPVYADRVAGDLRLADATQPGVDAGEVVKGINDEVPASWQYKGKAPDCGIREVGEPLPHYGPRPAK